MAEWGPFDALDNLSPEELRQRLRSLQAIIDARADPDRHRPRPRLPVHLRQPRARRAAGRAGRRQHLADAAGRRTRHCTASSATAATSRSDELPMQYAIAHRTAVSNEIEIVRADGSVLYVQNDVEPLYDTHGEIYGCVSVVRRPHRAQARRDRAARGRSPQGRIPRHARRTSCATRSRRFATRSRCMRLARGDRELDRAGARDDGAAGRAAGAADRRPARRRRASRRTRSSCGASASTCAPVLQSAVETDAAARSTRRRTRSRVDLPERADLGRRRSRRGSRRCSRTC